MGCWIDAGPEAIRVRYEKAVHPAAIDPEQAQQTDGMDPALHLYVLNLDNLDAGGGGGRDNRGDDAACGGTVR
ncbi:MAG: hypothetical protein QOE54_5087 [Streptosporangiaceae bacterium]|jgi:hypothetical protein|nr:hypothetical protein [Streptosporangiaceae bacterium]